MKYLLLLGALLFAMPVFATSGACSSHGGVNCSIPGFYATCNDYTQSSVLYSAMNECQTSYQGCTIQAQVDQAQQTCNLELQSQQAQCGQLKELNASMGQSTTGISCNTSTPSSCMQVSLCQQQVTDYQNRQQTSISTNGTEYTNVQCGDGQRLDGGYCVPDQSVTQTTVPSVVSDTQRTLLLQLIALLMQKVALLQQQLEAQMKGN